jgi:hypothetical protein
MVQERFSLLLPQNGQSPPVSPHVAKVLVLVSQEVCAECSSLCGFSAEDLLLQ